MKKTLLLCFIHGFKVRSTFIPIYHFSMDTEELICAQHPGG